jgi:hypothetical protein
MTETRRTLDTGHKSGLSGTGVAGFLLLGVSIFLWLILMAWNPSTSSQADGAGLAFMMTLLTLICLIIGGAMSLGTLLGGNRVGCDCAKCCGNASIGGDSDGGGSYSDDNSAEHKDSVGDMTSKESEGSDSWDPFETFYERGFKDGVKRGKEGPGAFDTFTDLLLAPTDYNSGVKEGQKAARKNK